MSSENDGHGENPFVEKDAEQMAVITKYFDLLQKDFVRLFRHTHRSDALTQMQEVTRLAWEYAACMTQEIHELLGKTDAKPYTLDQMRRFYALNAQAWIWFRNMVDEQDPHAALLNQLAKIFETHKDAQSDE